MKSGVLKSVTVLVGATTLAGCGLSIREHRG
jgi:predicted small lipoprotein YifL